MWNRGQGENEMKLQYRNRERALALLMSAVMLLAASLSGCAADGTAGEQQSNPPIQETGVSEPVDSAEHTPSSMTEDKTETVYIQAAPDGTVREITVETQLRNPGGCKPIQDYTRLSDIKNTEGDEEFSLSSDGSLVWENHGEDIHYKGVSQDSLPVTVKVTYYLNGQEITPEALAGQSGQVRIRFDYENHTAETVTVEEAVPREEDAEEGAPRETQPKEVSTQVPFGAISALFLPSDTFSNIEVSNGKVINLDGESMVIGYALPGLGDSLKLAEYEPTEEVSIPDYVEVTADVTGFSLDFTTTIISNGLLSDFDLRDLDDADDLIDDMKQLSDASQELVEGTEALYDGADEFSGYLSDYVKGVGMVDEGAAALAGGLKQLNDNKEALEQGAAALEDALTQVNDTLQTGLATLEEVLNGEELPDSELQALISAVKSLIDDAQALASQLGSIRQALEELSSFLDNVRTYLSAVEAAAEEAQELLSSIDLGQLESDAAGRAKAQVEKAVAEALQDTELTDEEKNAIRKQITDSIDLSGTTDPVQKQLDALQNVLFDLPTLEIPELSFDVSTINSLIDDMEAQLAVLTEYGSALSGTAADFADLPALLETLRDGGRQLQDGSTQLTDGITAFSDGIEALYSGANQLSSGTRELKSAGSALKEGFGALKDGCKELNEGFAAFDEEGIQSLADLAGEDLRDILTRFKGLKAADDSYSSFSGLRDGQTGSVKFILETDEISAKD